MNEVYARYVGDRPPARSTFEVAKLPSGRARRDRGRRAPVGARRTGACRIRCADRDPLLRPLARDRRLRRRRRRARRAARAPAPRRGLPRAAASTRPGCGRCSSHTVASRTWRCTASSSACASTRATARVRALAPAGIELTPPRAERSTGPGHRDFAIVSDASIALEEDMARRDFTINAMARPPRRRSARRPVRRRGRPRRGARSARSRRRASTRIRSGSCARCGSSPSSGSTSRPRPWRRCRRARPGSRTSRPSGSAAGSRRTAWASSRSSCSAASRARRSGSPATPACSSRSSPSSRRRSATRSRHDAAAAPARRAHLRRRAERRGRRRPPRGAPRRLLHDLGKPRRTPEARATQRIGAPDRATRSSRGSGIRPACGTASSGSSPATRSRSTARSTSSHARRFLAEHGDELALDLIAHKHADLAAKHVPGGRAGSARELARLVEQERVTAAPDRRPRRHGRRPDRDRVRRGPGASARRSQRLLDAVVDDPARNDRDWLLERAARGARVNVATVAEAYEAICAEVGPAVTVVAATKYVAAEEMGVLAEAGIEVVGENRVQDMQRKHELVRRRVPLALHRRAPVEQGPDRQRRSASSSTPSTPTRRPAGSRFRGCSR